MQRALIAALALAGSLALAPHAGAAGPADPLFRLLPPDAGIALAVENLRDRYREVAASPLADGLGRLPHVSTWLNSNPIRGVQRVVRQVEGGLNLAPGSIRDELFGDAVVLALRPGPPDAPEQARGVLLGRARDRAIRDRLIQSVDESQLGNGELSAVERKRRGPEGYAVRKYARAGRPDEFYATFDDGTFAWSNSEGLIHDILDRKAGGGPSLADAPGFRSVREALPAQALVGLYLSPRLLEASLGLDGRKSATTQERIIGLFARYVAALDYMGIALAWDRGVALHVHESIEPSRLDGWLRDWMTRPSAASPAIAPLPGSALAAFVIHLDFVALRDAAAGLVAERDLPWFRNLKSAAQGLLAGLDLDSVVLPRLGPGVLLFAEEPVQADARTRLPLVAVIGVKPGPETPGTAAAIENAIRTGISIYALEPAQASARLRVESRALGVARVLVLLNARRTLFALTSGPDRVVLGNLPESVARFGTQSAPSSLEAIRAANFPEATTFGVVDLSRAAAAIKPLRASIAERLAKRGRRSVEAIVTDLDQIVAAAEMFSAATFTATASPDATSVHRVFRLIAR
ncbi:hypothetical protein TA3x_003207 [Tundrisphaera sp. TA3]|uniref:hypothetical protein n=1 Tax=Tundrisphaera sp. TA3 TaxID=3435775 RepID=UPI003EBEF8A3